MDAWNVSAGTALWLACLLAAPAVALPPPTELDVPIDGGRPRVAGEKPPPPGKKLGQPAAQPPKTTPDAPEPPESEAATPDATKPEPPKPLEPPKPPEPPPALTVTEPAPPAPPRPLPTLHRRSPADSLTTPHTIAVLLDVGRANMPRAIIAAASGFDDLPNLVGSGYDLTILRPANIRHAYGIRLGMTVPTIPAANWTKSGTNVGALYHAVDLTFIDIAFEYIYRRRIAGPVGLLVRLGGGIGLAVGSVERVETLPKCANSVQTCPHWQTVGRHSSDLPSPVWPSLRASGGLFVDLADNWGLHVDAGLRDALWIGAGLSFRR